MIYRHKEHGEHSGNNLLLLLCALCVFGVLRGESFSQQAETNPAPMIDENVDHAGILRNWPSGEKDYRRGKIMQQGRSIYQSVCFACHGIDGAAVANPQARPFTSAPLQNGADPYSMFRTLTQGFKTMPQQTWLAPEQRYDVIFYIREEFLKKKNPSQYFPVTGQYLDTLPKPKAGAEPRIKDQDPKIPRDFGGALGSQVKDMANAGLTIALGADRDAAICYDLHRMKQAGLWRGGFLKLDNTQHYRQRGEGLPSPQGAMLPGLQTWHWTYARDISAVGPREPLPRKLLHYRGYYVHDRRIILSYDIEGRSVLEMPEMRTDGDGQAIIVHHFTIHPGKPITLCVGDNESPVISINADPQAAKLAADSQGRRLVTFPASYKRVDLAVARGIGKIDSPPPLVPLNELIKGGPRRWPHDLTTAGRLGQSVNGYALDTIDLPEPNPYNAWIRTTALDFLPDGRCVVVTYGGDAWLVSGLDASLKQPVWRRIAAGLYEPMGVKVVGDQIYVTCRDRIVRLVDLNGDGETDFYESFFADPDVSNFFHSFAFDLHSDSKGNFYYVKSGQYTSNKTAGNVIKVSPDGSSGQTYCTGFRTPNGMSILPDDRPVVSDNQGSWMPASKLSLVKPGGFYGYVQTHDAMPRWGPDGKSAKDFKANVPAAFDQPMLWMPQELDNSSGGQIWVADPRFGPLAPSLIHTSFGKAWMYRVMIDDIGAGLSPTRSDLVQAAIVRLPFTFDAGIQRARVNPADGQVYAVGLSGWDGPPLGRDGCLQRVRYTGQSVVMLSDIKARAGALHLTFNTPLQTGAALDIKNYGCEQWNYRWTPNYGSAHWSVRQPNQEGHDHLDIQSISISDDGKQVAVHIKDLRPAQQTTLRFALPTADGRTIRDLVYLTIHRLP